MTVTPIPAPPLWKDWSRPAAPTRLALAAGALASVVTALVLPLDRPGLGWLVAGVAGTVAVVAGRVAPQDGWHADRFGWAAVTIALLGVGSIRAADWLFALCAAAAVLTATLAVLRGRSMPALLSGMAATVAAAFRALPWVGQAVATRTGRSRPGITVSVGITVVLVVVFGALFASADAAFAELLGDVVPQVDAGTVARLLLLGPVIASGLAAAAFLRAAPPPTHHLETPTYHPVRRTEWLVPLAALDALFAVFVLVQATVLFGGSEHVLVTGGLTYAQYARSGFWQLLVVTGLTLLVLAGAVRFAPRADRRDRTLVRTLLGVLAALTLVIVASALYRMSVYAEAYGLTRLRMLVFACEVCLGVVFVLVLVAGIRLRAPWLPRAVVATGVLTLLVLAAVDPDRTVATYNLSRDRVDIGYLSTLSSDAVPAIEAAGGLTADQRACLLAPTVDYLDTTADRWYEYNLARATARRLLAGRPARWLPDCG